MPWTHTPQPWQRSLRIARPRANVVIAHGLGEHGGRYLGVAEALARIGCSTYAWDLRGWGEFPGDPEGQFGRLTSFGEYCENVEATLRAATSVGATPIPSFVLGHSMGALVALLVSLRKPGSLAGLILTSPALRFAVEVSLLKHAAARVASVFSPQREFPSRIDPDELTHDERERSALRADPLWQPVTRARWYTECLLAQREVSSHAQDLRTPTLVLAAEHDRIVELDATRAFFEALGSRDKQLQVCKGLYHEILHEREPGRTQVHERITNWIQARS